MNIEMLKGQQSHALVVLSNADPMRPEDAEFREWYVRQFRNSLMRHPEVLSLRQYKMTDVDVTKGKYPLLPYRYLSLVELSLDCVVEESSICALVREVLEPRSSSAGIALRMYYPGGPIVGSSLPDAEYVIVAFANPVVGREQEFREWYVTQHIRHALVYPVLSSGECLIMTRGQPASVGDSDVPYEAVAVYELSGHPNEFVEFNVDPTLIAFPAMDKSRFAETAFLRLA